MKKRILSLLLCLVLLLGAFAGTATAAADADTRLEVVRVLGIMVGDAQGNLLLDQSVTRAEFVKMMVAASKYKDSVTDGSGTAQFTDVKSDYWASAYIAAAVENGWVMGYIDGSFRPGRSITLEEGCTALLRMLGYDASTMAGSYPSAQLSKALSVGLRDDLSGERGHVLSRRDCVTLFYNLLLCQNSGGQVYGTTLGYTVKNNEIDYAALISADTKGPYVTETGALDLPFGTVNITVYRNGKLSDASAVQRYDVYYYHRNLRTVWAYGDKASGTLTAVSPNTVSPTSVTVGGTAYTIGTSAAAYQLSAQGSFRSGDDVTLLLGMDGSVVRVISAGDLEQVYHGVVLSSTTSVSSAELGSTTATLQMSTQVVVADGTVHTFYHGGTQFKAGTPVSVLVNSAGTTVTQLEAKRLSGTVGALGKSLGQYTFASDVQILDTDDMGGYAKVYPQRLAGCTLNSNNVLYYGLNTAGQIDTLILNNATGDSWEYAYITKANVRSGNTSVSASYTYVSDGKTSTVSGGTQYPVKEGGVVMQYMEGKLEKMYQLASAELTFLMEQTVGSSARTLRLAENVQVLLRDKANRENYYPTTLSQINAADYKLTGWYDSLGCPAGGRVRIIVAEPR